MALPTIGPGVLEFASEGDELLDEWFRIGVVVFRGPATTGDLCTLVDGDDKHITTISADTADEDVKIDLKGKWVKGITVSDLDSGSCEVHFAQT